MKFLFKLLFASLLFIGCTYSKKEVDYPVTTLCDTTNAKFSTTVLPIMTFNCNTSGCHNAANAAGGWILDDYNGMKDVLDNGNGRFLNSIEHTGSASQMPKGGGKLSNCDINKIKAWINAGAINN